MEHPRIRIYRTYFGPEPYYSEGHQIEDAYDYAFLTNQTFPAAASKKVVLTHCETHVCAFKLGDQWKYHNIRINFVPMIQPEVKAPFTFYNPLKELGLEEQYARTFLSRFNK